MQANTYDDSIQRCPLLPSQIVTYALIAAGTVAALWPVFSPVWHKTAAIQTRQEEVQANGSTRKPGLALVDEVQAAAERWQKDGFTWPQQNTPAGSYDEVLPVDMRDLENADLAPYRKAATQNWQGVEKLPTLAGQYYAGRLAASPWPHPGSAAIELKSAMAPDPEKPAKPWRVVLLFAASADATTHARQAVADAGGNLQEVFTLGRAAKSLLAVPMDRQVVDGLVTYYCICPTQSTIQVGEVKLSQSVPQTAALGDAAAAKRYADWKGAYDLFVTAIRARDAMATTPEQHQQIKNDVLTWKAAHPEPPRPPGSEAGTPTAAAND